FLLGVGQRSGSAPEQAAKRLQRRAKRGDDASFSALGVGRTNPAGRIVFAVMSSVLRWHRHGLSAEPGCRLPAARRDRRRRKVCIVVIDHVERVSAAIAGTFDTADELDDGGVVIALRRKHAAVAGG